ncbi:MAG: hypothetical protein ACKOWF_02515 [Chloroflexota bacterium]
MDAEADDLARARAAELLSSPERLAELRKDARLTAALGVAFSVLFVAGLLLLYTAPGAGAPVEELRAFYDGGDARKVVIGAVYVLPFAAVAFLWFIASLRSWLRFRASRLAGVFSTVQLLAGAAFIALVLGGAGAMAVGPLARDLDAVQFDLDTIRHFTVLARVLIMIFAMRMAAMVVMTTATIGAEAGLFPGWFRGLSIAVAAALFLAATLNVWLVALFPAWVLTLCALIVAGAREGQLSGAAEEDLAL